MPAAVLGQDYYLATFRNGARDPPRPMTLVLRDNASKNVTLQPGDGVVRRAEFFDAVGAVNRVVPPERRIDGDSVWGLLDCNGDGELERNELERGLRI